MKVKTYKSFPEQRKDKRYYFRLLFAYFYTFSIIPYLLLCLNFLRKHNKNKKKYKYNVSLCLIFKNEARFLNEWLTYHQLIGINHVYLYNNNSTDRYLEIINPFIKSGFVTLYQWPKHYAQKEAYEDCWEKTKNETHWLGFMDADEFVNLRHCNNITDFLSSYKNYPSVLLNWRMFGTSGHLTNKTGNVIESFTSCWPYLCDVGKSFINNDFKTFKIDVHYSTSKVFGIPIFPVSTKKIFNPFMIPVLSTIFAHDDLAYVNHYWSKDYEHYQYKDGEKGDVMSASNLQIKRKKGRFEYHELQNYDKDYSIQRWLIFLKQSLIQNSRKC